MRRPPTVRAHDRQIRFDDTLAMHASLDFELTGLPLNGFPYTELVQNARPQICNHPSDGIERAVRLRHGFSQ